MRILCIDIETSPTAAYIWSLWDQHVGINQILTPTEVICFAAKWLGEKKMFFYSVPKHGREEMVLQAHRLLDEADAVMHYNGKRFDVPHLNREFLLAGLKPPSPFVQIDLCDVAKRQFRFVSNKLAHVSVELGLEGKIDTNGFELWRDCMMGDKAAWKLMEKYNKQDVQLLEDLYGKLQPWIPGHPSRTLYDGITGCPVCGGEHLQKRGFAYTPTAQFQRYQCQDCGAWLRAGKRDRGVDLRRIAA